jgi:hypothetical protein
MRKKGFKLICNHIKGNISKSDKVLTPEYLDWHAKLTGLPIYLFPPPMSNVKKKGLSLSKLDLIQN